MKNSLIQHKKSDDNVAKRFMSNVFLNIKKHLNINFTRLSKKKREIDDCVNHLLNQINAADTYTHRHCVEVANISEIFAKRLNLPLKTIKKIYAAALIHDIGKTEIPNEILNKNGTLSPSERTLIKNHSTLGVKKIEEEYPELKELLPIIKYHHESWNGAGYPNGLSANEIPLEAQIISIVDSYHAILGRNYSQTTTPYEACKMLLNGAGSKWNPYLVFKFVKLIMSGATTLST